MGAFVQLFGKSGSSALGQVRLLLSTSEVLFGFRLRLNTPVHNSGARFAGHE